MVSHFHPRHLIPNSESGVESVYGLFPAGRAFDAKATEWNFCKVFREKKKTKSPPSYDAEAESGMEAHARRVKSYGEGERKVDNNPLSPFRST